MESECPGWWNEKGNACATEPYVDCHIDNCRMCLKSAWRAEDMSVEYKDFCVRCNRGWRDEDNGSYCVEEDEHHGDHGSTGTEEPETSYMWCPSTMVGCNLCEEKHIWMDTHYEPFTLCPGVKTIKNLLEENVLMTSGMVLGTVKILLKNIYSIVKPVETQ